MTVSKQDLIDKLNCIFINKITSATRFEINPQISVKSAQNHHFLVHENGQSDLVAETYGPQTRIL